MSLFDIINMSGDILAYLIIITGIIVLSRKNAIVSILFLILLYVWLSLYLYNIGLGVIGLLYLLIYVGAITILFLFILSLMNLKLSEVSANTNKPDYLLITITVFSSLSILGYIYSNNIMLNSNFDLLLSKNILNLLQVNLTSNPSELFVNNIIINNWSNFSHLTEMRVIGELLYTEYALLFIILGLTLLLSILGAISLLSNRVLSNKY